MESGVWGRRRLCCLRCDGRAKESVQLRRSHWRRLDRDTGKDSPVRWRHSAHLIPVFLSQNPNKVKVRVSIVLPAPDQPKLNTNCHVASPALSRQCHHAPPPPSPHAPMLPCDEATKRPGHHPARQTCLRHRLTALDMHGGVQLPCLRLC